MNKITRKAIIIAIIAGMIMFLDGVISNLLNQTASFAWVSFICWTVFLKASVKERLRAVIGLGIGFLATVLVIRLGNLFNEFNFEILGVGLSFVLATMLINFFCIELENFDKYIPISLSGIFVGMSMTFSGLGIGITIDTFENSLLIFFIIMLYGILGLLSGFVTLKFGVKD